MTTASMSDRLVRGLLSARGLRVLLVRATGTARLARMLHGLYPTSAHLFAEALASGLLVAALQKEKSRVNLQIACDGPVKGLFVDADPDGDVRGYVRGPSVHFPGDPGAGARAALGGSGYLSVLRDLGGGQFYRGQIELRAMDVARDLERYFLESEQVDTALDVCVLPREGEPLGDVAGVLVQKLPDGDAGAVAGARARLAAGALRDALAAGGPAQAVIAAVVGEGFEVAADVEVAYRCTCSLERARAAVSALGREGVLDVLAKDREAVITCEFCRERYVVGEAYLRGIAERLAAEHA
jgi:molecular chaperone Hsp33